MSLELTQHSSALLTIAVQPSIPFPWSVLGSSFIVHPCFFWIYHFHCHYIQMSRQLHFLFLFVLPSLSLLTFHLILPLLWCHHSLAWRPGQPQPDCLRVWLQPASHSLSHSLFIVLIPATEAADSLFLLLYFTHLSPFCHPAPILTLLWPWKEEQWHFIKCLCK